MVLVCDPTVAPPGKQRRVSGGQHRRELQVDLHGDTVPGHCWSVQVCGYLPGSTGRRPDLISRHRVQWPGGDRRVR